MKYAGEKFPFSLFSQPGRTASKVGLLEEEVEKKKPDCWHIP